MKFARVILCIALCLSSLNLTTQVSAATKLIQDQSDLVTVLKSEGGFLFLHNRDNVNFTLDFKGESFRQAQSEKILFTVDGKFLQIQLAPNSDFIKSHELQSLKNDAVVILEKHLNWEQGFLNKTFKTKLNVLSEKITLNEGRVALFWHFSMPAEMKMSVKHHVYLTTVIGNTVLVLNSGIESDLATSDIKNYLIEAMNTLKVSKTPFDLKKVQEQVSKG